MSSMNRSMATAMVCLLCLVLTECRRSGETTTPEGPGEQDDAQTEAARPPVFDAAESWGPTTASYQACPSSLCGTGYAKAASGQIRGCTPETVSDLETLPEPEAVSNARRDCSAVRRKAARPTSTPRGRSSRGRPSRGSAKRAPSGSPARLLMKSAGGADMDALLGGVTGVGIRGTGRGGGDGGGGVASPRSVQRSLDSPAYSRDAPVDQLLVIEAGATEGEPEVTQGTLRAQGSDGEIMGEFPLQHTEVSAEITGYIARTLVEQRYTNPFSEVIEAVYVFPLPGMSAVNDFVMEIGDRRIVGLIRPREEAERIYTEARARGQTASLLTQERPNIFTQNVANIEPGGEVSIRITFFEQLHYEAGHYEWAFPMVVGPRYIPGNAQASTQPPGGTGSSAPQHPGGGGTSPPTDQVPDADRITPPLLQPDERSGHDIGLSVTLDAGLPLQELVSVAHCVDVAEHGAERRVVRLLDSDSIPNRDFVLRWSVAGAETQFGVLAHRGENGGFLTLMMQPPLAPTDEQVTPREITFLLDVSGSMSGLPLGIAKSLVNRSLDRLRPDDLFNIFFFASGNGQLWEQAHPNTPENIAAARQFLDQLCGSGGTEMLAGVRRALSADHDPQYLQMFVFATDGFIGNERDILRVIQTERGQARFFAFGIGSSVNRYLIEGIGRVGGGASGTILPRDPISAGRAVQRLFDMIDSPVLVDVRINWNGLPVVDQYPSDLPDLYAGQTISVIARYNGPATGTAFIEARLGAQQLRLPVQAVLPESDPANAALAPIWARARIAELSMEMIAAEEPERQAALQRQITEVALQFNLVSQFTAFVAVDESRIVGDGTPLRVMQPVEMPEDVSYEGVFGEQPIGEAFRVPAWGLVLRVSQSGRVGVVMVQPNSPADAAGISPGAIVTRVDGTLVHDLQHLEGLVLQSGSSLRVTFEPGGEATLPGPTP